MDAREFYVQIDKADDELKAVGVDLYKIFRDTDHLQYIFSDLSILSERLYEIGEECYKLSAEIETVREYDFSGLVCEAEEMADEDKKTAN